MARRQRSDDRYSVQVNADPRGGASAAREINVTNLSRSGCRFVADRYLQFGARIAIAAGRSGVLHARVVWRLGKAHGVRFEKPLPQPVFDHLRLFLSEHPALVAERQAAIAA